MVRLVTRLGRRQVLAVDGLEHVTPENDPFVLVGNHNQRLEAVLLPAILIAMREGKRLHFLADWPMMLIPGVGFLYRRGGVIPVGNKSARFKFLDVLRPLYCPREPALQRAKQTLRRGASIGIFPETTINRDPRRLLRGRPSAARLALEAGVPIVPFGIRFPELPADAARISDRDRLTITIGEPIETPPPTPRVSVATVRAWHARIMTDIARLSGKSWSPDAPRS